MRGSFTGALGFFFPLAMTIAACGGEVVVENNDDGSGGIGGSGGNGGVGNIPNECLPYADEPGQGDVTIAFTNDSGLPIYLPVSCELNYDILPKFGMDPTYYGPKGGCLFTCEDLWTMEDVPACAPCAEGAYRLDPGEELEVVWNGTGLLGVEMPTQCFASSVWAPDCSQIVTANAGEYYVDIVGYSDCPNCACDQDGYCVGQVGGIQAYPDFSDFTIPADDFVEVNFGVCAIPCPG